MAKASSTTACYGEIPERVRNKEIYDSIVKQFGTKVVLIVFLISNKIDDLDEHFKKNPPKKGQLKSPRLLNQLSNSPNTFDLTLLHQLLRTGGVCDKIENDQSGLWDDAIKDSVDQETASLESLLYTIIQEKNAAVSHGSIDTDLSEQNLKEKCDWFTKLCTLTLKNTSDRFKDKKVDKDLETFEKDMKVEIAKRFKTERTIDMTPDKEKDKLILVREHFTEIYHNECKFPIRGWLKSKRDVTPSSLYTDVHMEEYFENYETSSKTPRQISSKDILIEAFSDATTQALVISGPNGIGKSTLARHLQDLWVRFSKGELEEDESESIKDFDILFHIQCKSEKSGLDRFLRKLHGGIAHIFPQFDQFNSWLFKRKILMILEGFDELGDKTEGFTSEMENFIKKTKACKLIVTTRKINDGMQLTKAIGIENSLAFIIKGIPVNLQLKFSKMIIDFLVEDEENKNNLVYKLEIHWPTLQENLENLLSRPLILSIVSYMWAENPSKVNNLTTTTEFMEGLRESQIKNLVETIFRRNPKDRSEKELQDDVKKYLELFDNVNLRTYLADQFDLNGDLMTILKDACHDLKFIDKDEEDILDTFLETSKGSNGEPSCYFVHQLFQTYSAAKSIEGTLKKSPVTSDKSKFVEILKLALSMYKENKILERNKKIQEYSAKSKLTDQDMDIMRDIFLHVTGIISGSSNLPIDLYNKSMDLPQKEYASYLKNSLDPSNVDTLLLHAAESWNSKFKSYNIDIIDAIAFILQSNNQWRIWNTACLKGLLPILKQICPASVILDFHQDVSSLYQLKESLELISNHKTDLSLFLHQHYNHQTNEFSNELLKIITEGKTCILKEFKGALGNLFISHLPSCLTNLQLYIEDNTVQLLYENLDKLTNLRKLELKVKFYTHMYLEDLPADDFCGDHFELSIVSEVSNADVDCEWLAETTAAMLPRKNRHCTKQLSFLSSTLEESGMKELLVNLKWHKVIIAPLSTGKLLVESTETLKEAEYKELNKMVKDLGRVTLFWKKV